MITKYSAPAATGGVGQALADGLVITWRNLKRIPRIPERPSSWGVRSRPR